MRPFCIARPNSMDTNTTLQERIKANDPYINQAYQLLAQNKTKEVATLLNHAQRNTTDDPRIYMIGAQLAERTGRYDDALQALEHAVALTPQWWPAQLEYGLLLARLDKYTPALEQAEKIFALESTERMALAGVIDIAIRCGDLGKAAQYNRRALEVYPDDPVLELNLARTLHHSAQYEQALPLWDRLIERDPETIAARYGRLHSLMALGRLEQARADVEHLLHIDPQNPVYLYYQQVVNGQPPKTQPPELVRELFDAMTQNYDLHMVRRLRYELPKLIAQRILEIFPERQFNLLDLGCGTGLLGLYLGAINGAMVGVDVSREMMQRASLLRVYDKFHSVDLTDAVRDTPASLYDIVTALDVFPYIGDLSPIIGNVHRILQNDGFFFFSTEAAAEAPNGYVLQANGRYAHSRKYLEQLLADAGFAMATLEEKTLRFEADQPVKGYVITAQKGH